MLPPTFLLERVLKQCCQLMLQLSLQQCSPLELQERCQLMLQLMFQQCCPLMHQQCCPLELHSHTRNRPSSLINTSGRKLSMGSWTLGKPDAKWLWAEVSIAQRPVVDHSIYLIGYNLTVQLPLPSIAAFKNLKVKCNNTI